MIIRSSKNKLLFITLFLSVFSVVLIVSPKTKAAECQLSDIYPAVQINKSITTIPVPYTEGETLTATIKTKTGYNCENFVAEFRACPIVGSSVQCDQAAIMGNATIKNGETSLNWTVKKLSGADTYRIRAVVGTNVNNGVSEVYSPTISIASSQVCTITNFTATKNGTTGPMNLVIKSNDKCEGKSATVQLMTQDAKGNQSPGGIIAQGTIKNNQFVSSWSGSSPTVSFFFRGAIAGGGFIDSNIFLNGEAVPTPSTPTSTTTPTQPQTTSFEITNPLKGGANNIFDFIGIITTWIFNLAIPVAVIFILYAGFLFLTAGPYPAHYQKAKQVLTYTAIGLAIIFIGKGFVTLIQSILDLGGGGTSSNPPITTTATYGCSAQGICVQTAGGQFTDSNCGGYCSASGPAGDVGSLCSKDSNCVSGLVCNNTVCQRPGGNNIGEYCLSGANCSTSQGLSCDLATTTKVYKDGRQLGICYKP